MAGGGRKRRDSAAPDGKDDRLALALAQGMTRSEAASHAGVGERTVYSKLQDPNFRAFVNGLRDRLISEAVGKLAASGSVAASRLIRLMDSDDERIALQAANAIIGAMVKLGSYHELTARVAELESRIAASAGGKGLAPGIESHDRWSRPEGRDGR